LLHSQSSNLPIYQFTNLPPFTDGQVIRQQPDLVAEVGSERVLRAVDVIGRGLNPEPASQRASDQQAGNEGGADDHCLVDW